MKKYLPWPETPYFLVMGYCVLVLVYGLLRFPDGPIAPCGLNSPDFCGKHGALHSAGDFQAYLAWQQTLFISWPFGMISAALLYLKGRRRRRAQSS